ncbi:hypothetical protein ACQ4PT_061315 [Festuca glaucescens]
MAQEASPAATVPGAAPAPAERRGEEALAAFRARRKKERETEPEESRTDVNAYEARLYRVFWNDMFAGECGSYEDATSIPPMCFTGGSRSDFVHERDTMQIFSIKVEAIRGGLQWPLDVYGMVAARDVVDHNRNIIFHRERDNCQRITEEDPYLALTGPIRAILLSVDPTYVEVDLKVKGALKSEDKDLSSLALAYRNDGPSRSYMMHRSNTTSKLSKLELAVAHIMNSVEATISVEVINGDWPRGFRGVFTANTASMDDMKATLLAFGDGRLPVDGRSKIVKLSRRVVCVELRRPEMEKGKKSKLKISAQAMRINRENDMWRHGLVFTPERAGKSRGTLKVGSCEMEVTVAWSLLSAFKCSYDRRG